MDLNLSSEDRAFREEVRTFIDAHLPAELVRAQQLTTSTFCEPEIIRPWHRALYERGWVAPGWPAEYGGPGWTPVQRYIFDVECARADAPQLSPMGLRMVGPVIIGFGSPEQQEYYLPRILSGEDYWCQGYSEPGAGSDLASLRTRAVRDGDAYVINGSKIWTTHAHHANRMFALVRTGDGERKQEGISFVLIDMDTPGITIRPIRTIGGDHEVNQVFLDDVRIPASNRVGEEGKGWTYGKYLLQFERGGAMASARLRRHLDSVERAASREAAGEPGMATRIATIEQDIDALEMIELRIMSALQTGETPGAISSLLKLRATEIRQAITALGLDLAGSAGVTWSAHRPLYELDPGSQLLGLDALALAPSYLNARAATIFGGSSEIQREIMARTMLGL